MRLSEIFEAGGVIARPSWQTFEEAVRGLVAELVASRQLDASIQEAAISAICEREASDSTAMFEIGVSVPHARLEGVHGLVAAIAASPTAVYVEAAGVPIRIMVLLLSAPELVAEHLRFLSKVSLLLHSRAVRQALRDAPDRASLLAVLRTHEGR